MHGLIFETSICYWQDQPGSRPSCAGIGAGEGRAGDGGAERRRGPARVAPSASRRGRAGTAGLAAVGPEREGPQASRWPSGGLSGDGRLRVTLEKSAPSEAGERRGRSRGREAGARRRASRSAEEGSFTPRPGTARGRQARRGPSGEAGLGPTGWRIRAAKRRFESVAEAGASAPPEHRPAEAGPRGPSRGDRGVHDRSGRRRTRPTARQPSQGERGGPCRGRVAPHGTARCTCRRWRAGRPARLKGSEVARNLRAPGEPGFGILDAVGVSGVRGGRRRDSRMPRSAAAAESAPVRLPVDRDGRLHSQRNTTGLPGLGAATGGEEDHIPAPCRRASSPTSAEASVPSPGAGRDPGAEPRASGPVCRTSAAASAGRIPTLGRAAPPASVPSPGLGAIRGMRRDRSTVEAGGTVYLLGSLQFQFKSPAFLGRLEPGPRPQPQPNPNPKGVYPPMGCFRIFYLERKKSPIRSLMCRAGQGRGREERDRVPPRAPVYRRGRRQTATAGDALREVVLRGRPAPPSGTEEAPPLRSARSLGQKLVSRLTFNRSQRGAALLRNPDPESGRLRMICTGFPMRRALRRGGRPLPAALRSRDGRLSAPGRAAQLSEAHRGSSALRYRYV
ncbi:collagen alpha-2(I) chain-like [Ahaetulla prasina]|uniref:collagen alpha-2(I) chain-like n=1 Tax=Ahaetulla prasina TaxID=499056 RepID=UPI00264842D4|nr:collagen alpha-2(I) chain-like [Ahaetulla prasina]